jgi:hypothetical protein
MRSMFETFLNCLDRVADCQLAAARRYMASNDARSMQRALDAHDFARDQADRLRASAERAAVSDS